MQAGDLDRRIAFDAPVVGDDGHGGEVNGWTSDDDAVKVSAHIRYLRGGETVQAERLAGRQPAVITVRRSSQTRLIDTSWRVRDAQSGDIYNIRSGPVPSDDRLYLEFTVESGVAV
jgi:SPP1 family predicted phage head-tail adaptor